MKNRLRPGFQRQRGRCLRHPVTHGGYAENSRAPEAFGISTARTGGGKYVPDDIRFQILYRLFPRSALKSSIVTRSAPGAPPLTATRFHACQISCFGMSNGLSVLP